MENKVVLPIEKEKTVTIEIIFSFPNEMEHEEIKQILEKGLGTISIGGDLLENLKDYHINYDYMLPDFDDYVLIEDNYFEY